MKKLLFPLLLLCLLSGVSPVAADRGGYVIDRLDGLLHPGGCVTVSLPLSLVFSKLLPRLRGTPPLPVPAIEVAGDGLPAIQPLEESLQRIGREIVPRGLGIPPGQLPIDEVRDPRAPISDPSVQAPQFRERRFGIGLRPGTQHREEHLLHRVVAMVPRIRQLP